MVMIMNMIMLIQLIVALQFLQEGARIQAQLTLSLTTLAKTKEKYEKVSILNRGSPLEIILSILPFPGFWCKWKSTGVLQQGGRGPQLVQGWRGEAEDELEHQKAAGDDQIVSCCILLIWHFLCHAVW